MEAFYNGQFYYLKNDYDLNRKQLTDTFWFYIKNKDVDNIEQLTELRICIKYYGNEFDDQTVLDKIKMLEKNIFS